MGAVTRITSMGTLVVFGFLKGFQPIAGFSYGTKKFDRLREAIKTSILWSTIFCVVVGLTITLFSTQIISQFTEGNTEVISVGQKSLMANGFSFFVFGFFSVSCTWKRHRRIRSWGLPTRYLLCSDHSVAPIILGHKWNTICTTDCRCNFCYCYCVYGSTSS